MRRNITEGKPGIPLRLHLGVVNAGTCLPIPDALVDIWHADGEGLYSGYEGQGDRWNIDTREETFLRGIQVTGDDGKVEFATIYPGWYPGRTTHVHFKVQFNDQTAVTSQLYFPGSVTNEVYSHSPYRTRGHRDTSDENDTLFTGRGTGASLRIEVVEDGGGYVGSYTIGIAT